MSFRQFLGSFAPAQSSRFPLSSSLVAAALSFLAALLEKLFAPTTPRLLQNPLSPFSSLSLPSPLHSCDDSSYAVMERESPVSYRARRLAHFTCRDSWQSAVFQDDPQRLSNISRLYRAIQQQDHRHTPPIEQIKLYVDGVGTGEELIFGIVEVSFICSISTPTESLLTRGSSLGCVRIWITEESEGSVFLARFEFPNWRRSEFIFSIRPFLKLATHSATLYSIDLSLRFLSGSLHCSTGRFADFATRAARTQIDSRLVPPCLLSPLRASRSNDGTWSTAT